MRQDIRKQIDELNLEKFYDKFKYDELSYMFNECIYLFRYNECTYIGNKQIPNLKYEEYTKDVNTRYSYWFNGDCSEFQTLYMFSNVSNTNKFNQRVLNLVKKEIIDKLQTTFQIQLMPDDFDINEMYAKNISDWQKKMRVYTKTYSIDECRKDLLEIIDEILADIVKWTRLIFLKNRYFFISNNSDDIEERTKSGFEDWSDKKKCLFIMMKDWLTMIIENTYNQKHSETLMDFKNKLSNYRYKNHYLFGKITTKFFETYNQISLILSLLYISSSQIQINNVCEKFKNWRDKFLKNYNNKNNLY